MHQLKKECTSWEVWVKFYLGQNKDYSQETAFQIVPRNFSEEVGWEVSTYVILVKAEYVQLSPCFFCRRLTDASIHQLLNSYCLPGSWLTIKIYFQYFYERASYADTIDLFLPLLLLSSPHSLQILLISRMLDERKVWTAIFFIWSPQISCIHTFRSLF